MSRRLSRVADPARCLLVLAIASLLPGAASRVVRAQTGTGGTVTETFIGNSSTPGLTINFTGRTDLRADSLVADPNLPPGFGYLGVGQVTHAWTFTSSSTDELGRTCNGTETFVGTATAFYLRRLGGTYQIEASGGTSVSTLTSSGIPGICDGTTTVTDEWSQEIDTNRGRPILDAGSVIAVDFLAETTEPFFDGTLTRTSTGILRIREGDPPTEINFAWTMPDRYGADEDANGLIDSFPPDGDLEIDPGGWRVDFDAAPDASCDGELQRTWRIEGATVNTGDPSVIAYDPSSCDFAYRFPAEGTYSVELEVADAEGQVLGFKTHDVIVQDWLIVSIGDSVASGEGHPDIPGPPVWQNEQCHRSALAGPARAARLVEDADPRTSVTFVHLACSGATVVEGLLGSYRGIERGRALLPQVDELASLAGAREIDAVLVSIGANDVHFSGVVFRCLLFKDCHLIGPGSPASQFENDIVRLPIRYDTLGNTLANLDVLPNRVYLTQYFDPTRNDTLGLCDNTILGDHPVVGKQSFGITAAEADWASNNMMVRLNAEVFAATIRHGWNHVGGIVDAFLPHGYCADFHWVVKYAESMSQQGDKDGSLHPNAYGHAFEADQIAAELRSDLYEGGQLDSPRPPREF